MQKKVIWMTNEEIEKIAGYRRLYKNSWIKGVCDNETHTIYLNSGIRNLKHPNFFEAETLSHELFHMINRFSKLDIMFDGFGRIIDQYIFCRNHVKGERKRK